VAVARRGVLLICVVSLVCLAGCGIGNVIPRPDAAPPDAPTKRILLVGDSLMLQAEPAISDTLAWYHLPAEIFDVAVGGSSPTCFYPCDSPPPNMPTPVEWVQEAVAAYQPDIVLCDWGFNVDQHYDDPGFDQAAYRSATLDAEEQIADVVHDAGVPLYWALAPQIVDPWWNAIIDTNADRAANLPAHGVTIFSWRAALDTRDGFYADSLLEPENGSIVQVRADDHAHLATAGANRVAAWTVAAIRPQWDIPNPPTTTTTTPPDSTTTTTTPPDSTTTTTG
jgi:hypothetical protein